jgi:hypothetical protein
VDLRSPTHGDERKHADEKKCEADAAATGHAVGADVVERDVPTVTVDRRHSGTILVDRRPSGSGGAADRRDSRAGSIAAGEAVTALTVAGDTARGVLVGVVDGDAATDDAMGSHVDGVRCSDADELMSLSDVDDDAVDDDGIPLPELPSTEHLDPLFDVRMTRVWTGLRIDAAALRKYLADNPRVTSIDTLVFAARCASCRVVSSRLVLCPVLSCRVVSCRVVSCRVVSCPVLSCPVLSCPVLSCPVLSCRVGAI